MTLTEIYMKLFKFLVTFYLLYEFRKKYLSSRHGHAVTFNQYYGMQGGLVRSRKGEGIFC